MFCKSDDDDIIRISFKNVRFDHSAREILLNIIGRYLSDRARQDVFRDRPMIVFLDKAHPFLGGTIGDEYGRVYLDAFGLIAHRLTNDHDRDTVEQACGDRPLQEPPTVSVGAVPPHTRG